MGGDGKPENEKNGALGGKGAGKLDPLILSALSYAPLDKSLLRHETASIAEHAKVLTDHGFVQLDELDRILEGIRNVYEKIGEGNFKIEKDDEDVHAGVLRHLAAEAGPAVDQLHIKRSSDFQKILNQRGYTLLSCRAVGASLTGLLTALRMKARSAGDRLMPGYTHLQRAQPVLIAHHLMAYHAMFTRDHLRFLKYSDKSLSNPALPTAVTLNVTRADVEFQEKTFKDEVIIKNSADPDSSYDGEMMFAANAAILASNLSRLGEELVLWSSSEFDYVSFPDEVARGDDLAPYRKYPEAAEILRAKSGRVIGNMVAVTTILKGLPLSRNSDYSEILEKTIDTVDTLVLMMDLAKLLIDKLSFNYEKMEQNASDPFMAATDLADSLVLKGVPFREAHRQVGALVSYALENSIYLPDMTADVFLKFCPAGDPAFLKTLSPRHQVMRRNTADCGTGPEKVDLAVKSAEDFDAGVERLREQSDLKDG